MQCPHCNRTVATVPGATRIQCFGCGRVIELGSSTTQSRAKGGNDSGKKAVFAIVFISLGLLLVVGVGLGAFFFFFNQRETAQNNSAPVAADESSAADSAQVEEMVPAYVATDEDRSLAAKVPDSIQQQIIQMWDQLTSSTRKKLLIPKNSPTRNRVESMLSGIEQREIQRMAALFSLEESEINAVIQVTMAERAKQELDQNQGR